MRFILILPYFLFYLNLSSQDDWDFENKENKNKLFLDTRVVNGHTVNTLEKKVLDFRITHRFGEIATINLTEHYLDSIIQQILE